MAFPAVAGAVHAAWWTEYGSPLSPRPEARDKIQAAAADLKVPANSMQVVTVKAPGQHEH